MCMVKKAVPFGLLMIAGLIASNPRGLRLAQSCINNFEIECVRVHDETYSKRASMLRCQSGGLDRTHTYLQFPCRRNYPAGSVTLEHQLTLPPSFSIALDDFKQELVLW